MAEVVGWSLGSLTAVAVTGVGVWRTIRFLRSRPNTRTSPSEEAPPLEPEPDVKPEPQELEPKVEPEPKKEPEPKIEPELPQDEPAMGPEAISEVE